MAPTRYFAAYPRTQGRRLGLPRVRSLAWSRPLAKHKYGFEKRQRELNKEKKKAEKAQRKLERTADAEPAEPTDEGAEPTPPPQS